MNKPLVAILAVIVLISGIFLLPQDKINILKPVPTEEFTVVIHHTKYEPSSIAVKAGTKVVLNIANIAGTEEYNQGITIEGYGIDELAPAQITFKADKIGTFQAYCGRCLDGPFGRDVPDKRMTLIVN